jgi:hypothetical protein
LQKRIGKAADSRIDIYIQLGDEELASGD